MPYKAVGKWVYILKNKRWIRFKRHKTEEDAKRHAQALNINVTQKEK